MMVMVMARVCQRFLIALLLFFGSSFFASSMTDPVDLSALQALYESLNCPPQLIGWNRIGGDPCGYQPWIGVKCSGKSVISINIKGLGVGGFLGSQLSKLISLKKLDMSYNNIGGKIPESLPPNATYINLAMNNFYYSIPYPSPSLKALTHLNVSHNSLSGPIGNVFTDMPSLEELDFSFNHFTGDLPSSFGSLAKLHTLYLQNNELTGSVVLLANLSLSVLYLQNNHLSGYVPKQFEIIPSLRIDGNLFQPGFKVPPTFVNGSTGSPLPSTDERIARGLPAPIHNNRKGRLHIGAVAGIISAVLLVVISAAAVLIQIYRSYKSNLNRFKTSDQSLHALPVTAPEVVSLNSMPRTRLPSGHNVKPERVSRRKSCSRKSKSLPFAKLFSASELLEATNSYSEDNVVGQGPNGHVYKAEFPDGQILAVKKINMVALSVYEEEEFVDIVWNLSRLSHPNISKLFGYSVEQGEHILVYEYAKNGSLDDVLFSSNDLHNALSWKARVRIALSVAYALEYLHCVCSPPIAHGNMKASNILLDHELTPHVSDCGLTVLGHLTDTEPKVSEVSNGYAASELTVPGADMTKSDIYSYGVVLLELLTRRRAFDSSKKEEEQLLVKWASSRLHDFSSLEGMVDPAIKGTIPSKVLSRFADIILMCIQPEPEYRSPATVIAESLISLVQKMAHPHRHSNRKRSSVEASGLNVAEQLSFKSTFPYFEPPSSPTFG